MQAACPSCGFQNVDSAKFCSECGAALTQRQPLRREERKVVTVVYEDDPERAVRAALAFQSSIAELNERHPGLELQVRISVATGEALVTARRCSRPPADSAPDAPARRGGRHRRARQEPQRRNSTVGFPAACQA